MNYENTSKVKASEFKVGDVICGMEVTRISHTSTGRIWLYRVYEGKECKITNGALKPDISFFKW